MGEESLYLELLNRCASLEERHTKLKDLMMKFVEENGSVRQRPAITSGSYGIYNTSNNESSWRYIPGYFTSGSPYQSILKCIGHGICVTSPSSGKVIFWNRAAEVLYGWEEDEVLGNCIIVIAVPYELQPAMRGIMKRTCYGHTWSGQFPFKKKSGNIFTALTLSSPMYEDNELTGIITVSSDAAVYNRRKPAISLQHNHRKNHHETKPPPASPFASSASTLASRLLLWSSFHDPPNWQPSTTQITEETDILNYVNGGFSAS